jgi:preprotein translocase subunit SecG
MWFISGQWLSDGEIAAIVLGVFLFIFIIIVIVLAILLCKKQRAHSFHHSSFQQASH